MNDELKLDPLVFYVSYFRHRPVSSVCRSWTIFNETYIILPRVRFHSFALTPVSPHKSASGDSKMIAYCVYILVAVSENIGQMCLAYIDSVSISLM